MSSISYKEKSLYAMLVADVLVYVPYFVYALHGHATIGRLIGTILALSVLSIVLQSIIAATTRNRLTDERDALIEYKGYRAAYFALATGIILIFVILWIHAPADINHPHFGAFHIINVLLAALVVADITKLITQLAAYRRSL